MVKKIVADWSLGTKFRELKVYTYNYNEESITTYGKSYDGNMMEISKTVSHINSGKREIYKVKEAI